MLRHFGDLATLTLIAEHGFVAHSFTVMSQFYMTSFPHVPGRRIRTWLTSLVMSHNVVLK